MLHLFVLFVVSEVVIQEVQTAAEAALKDLVAKEKEEVGLQERKKHATTKAKKLKKSITDVRYFHSVMPVTAVNICFCRTQMLRRRLSATSKTILIRWRRRKLRLMNTKPR